MSAAKGKAPTAPTVEALSVSKPLEQGTNVSNSTQVTPVSAITPDLAIIEGKVTTTSQQIAQHFGKRHADVIRAIRQLGATAEFTERNFALSEYSDVTGRKLPAYRITRDGFTLLAMGFTGKEATAWKIAYIEAFNAMEAELQRIAPQIDYRRISPAEAQSIRELIDNIVKTGLQTFGETYRRLHAKFRVNSYLELPAAQYEDVRQYLMDKAPMAPTYDAKRVQQSLELANQAAARVQSALFEALMSGEDDLAMDRWLVAFHHGRDNTLVPAIMTMGRQEMVVSMDKVAKRISENPVVADETLLEISTVCLAKLTGRAHRKPASRIAA